MTGNSKTLMCAVVLLVLPMQAPSLQGAQGPTADKQEMIDLGLEHETAMELYQALKEQANGGQRLEWDNLPDWTGIYTRGAGGLSFDPDQPPGGLPPANLTPEFRARMLETIELAGQGIQWDPISTCAPPGHPRWLTEPFLKDFVVTPDQTYLINEMVNDIRRIYTDGRAHTAEADRYPMYNGDSVGFWNGHKLVIHTNQLREGIYQRNQPNYTDQVETVEIWEKVDDRNLEVAAWVYDPPALVEPWYTRQVFTKLENPDYELRIRYWACSENQNNSVFQNSDGATDFTGFTFTDEDNREGDPQ